MATTFVIVQHGEKEPQPGDPGLTPVGRQQAAAAAHAVSTYAPAAVYSSPLRRARETATTIAAALGLEVREDPALTERMNWTGDGGLTLDQFLEEWRRATADRQHRPRVGDSSADAGARLESALLRYAVEHGGETVVCVSHGGVTTDLLRTVLGDAEVRARAPSIIDDGVPGGAVTVLTRRADGWLVDDVAVSPPGWR